MADRSLMLRRLQWLESAQPVSLLGRFRKNLFSLIAVLLMSGIASIKFVPRAAAEPPNVTQQIDEPDSKSETAKSNETAKRKAITKTKKNSARRPGNADIYLTQTTAKIFPQLALHFLPARRYVF